MIGAILGDFVGSIYEFNNIKTKDFNLYDEEMEFTDDSILTIATAHWLLKGGEPGAYYCEYANKHRFPMGGYGGMFSNWVTRCMENNTIMPPYNSCGNGSAMRVSPVGWFFNTEQEVLEAAKRSAECTHNHPEGIKGAQAVALAILLARRNTPVNEIARRIEHDFGYNLSLSVDEIRKRYSWNGMDDDMDGGTCQGSVPQAISCALQATDFEDALRNAVSIAGDSDTIACIAGGIAQAIFGLSQPLVDFAMSKLDPELKSVVDEFVKVAMS